MADILNIEVIGWTDACNPKYKEFGKTSFEEDEAIQKVIAKKLREKGYKFSGGYHQNGDYGAPVIRDISGNEYVYTTTQRSWGGIMAEAYPEENINDGYDYCRWAWLIPEGKEQIIPSEQDRIETKW